MMPKFALLTAAFVAGSQAAAVDWNSLNRTLDGRLQKSVPLEKPCFTSYNGQSTQVDKKACDVVRANYTLSALRIGTPQSYMQLTNQVCMSDTDDQCVLDDTSSPAKMPSSKSACGQGNVPSYYIEIKTADDVAAAFAFAKKHTDEVEISVKNSGHDFMMRSSGKSTLNLWTHNLQGMKYHADFKPKGCGKSVGAAMTVNVGVQSVDAYNFADKHNALILGPYAPSVPISGGWVSGAGHSVFSPVYGLGADRVVEFGIVTPDGKERTVNTENDAELFWALRGGGGGTFGVVLSATHRVEPRKPIAYADIHLPDNATTEDSLKWVELLLEESVAWGEAGWGGHVGGSFVTHFNPLSALTGDKGAAAKAAFKRASDFALKLGGTSNILVAESFSEIYNKYNVPADMNMGGGFEYVTSRLMPKSEFGTKEGRDSLIQYMRKAMSMGFDPRSMYTPVTTPFVYKGKDGQKKESETSMTQAWYKALWLFETSGSMAIDSTYKERLGFMTNLTSLTLDTEKFMGSSGGSYQNEANPFTPNWKDAYWGTENYEKLLKIKNKYDPKRLLKCWKCVGFDDEKDVKMTRFSCNAKMQADLNTALKQ